MKLVLWHNTTESVMIEQQGSAYAVVFTAHLTPEEYAHIIDKMVAQNNHKLVVELKEKE